jgi:hypothetical protein
MIKPEPTLPTVVAFLVNDLGPSTQVSEAHQSEGELE